MTRPGRFAAAVALVAVAGVAVWWLISVQLATGPEAAPVTTVTVTDDAFAAVVIPVGETGPGAGRMSADTTSQAGLPAPMQNPARFHRQRFDDPAAIPTSAQCTPACAAW